MGATEEQVEVEEVPVAEFASDELRESHLDGLKHELASYKAKEAATDDELAKSRLVARAEEVQAEIDRIEGSGSSRRRRRS